MEMQVDGTMVAVNTEMRPLYQKTSQIMVRGIQGNFLAGGRPKKWKQRKDGRPSHLMGTPPRLLNSVVGSFSDSYADVEMANTIHNLGGVIQHPGSDLLQVFQINGRVVFTHHTKPHKIFMPQRQYAILAQETIDEIVELFASKLFTTKTFTTE
jgi:phage gpG-like protein